VDEAPAAKRVGNRPGNNRSGSGPTGRGQPPGWPGARPDAVHAHGPTHVRGAWAHTRRAAGGPTAGGRPPPAATRARRLRGSPLSQSMGRVLINTHLLLLG
jgi:hypothetical protein